MANFGGVQLPEKFPRTEIRLNLERDLDLERPLMSNVSGLVGPDLTRCRVLASSSSSSPPSSSILLGGSQDIDSTKAQQSPDMTARLGRRKERGRKENQAESWLPLHFD